MNIPLTLRARLTGAFMLLLLAVCHSAYAYDLTVAKDGTGNYTTVQAAIDAAPAGRTTPFTIFIKNGRYKELVNVPATKPFIQLVGENVGSTIITYNNSGGTIVNGVALGTQNSASVTINATDFSALNVTFENSFGEAASNGQAVAILVNSDRAAFRNCRFLGNQDTMYLKGNGTPRQYFLNCYIEGNTDFIFGSAIALFENCNVYAKNKTTTSTSYIAVPNTPAGQAFGLVFKNCNVTGHSVAGGTSYDLGRPWQANPKAAFLNCNLSTPIILAEGWSPTSSAGTATIRDAYFVEYQNTHFNGRAINVSSRVLSGQGLTPLQPSTQLTATEAATYTKANILSGWDPCSLIDCTTAFPKTVIVNNFKGAKGTSTSPSTFTWNMSWPIAGDLLSVYRATATPPAALGAFAVVNTQTEPSDTIFNYAYSDAIPPSGSLYKYFVRGSATPRQLSSDTVTISSAPAIVITGTLGGFTQQLGTGSGAQSVAVAGTDLVAPVTVTASANYQVSLTSGGTYASSVSLASTAGALASTPVYVRLNATTAGPYTGTLTLTSTNAATVVLNLSGTAIVAPTITSNVLEWWPLRVNATDSAQARNARLMATMPIIKRLYLSNGTTMASIPAYSNAFGQAFGASAAGDGQWSAAAGGPGGTLSRMHYEQFTVTVAAGATAVRVDSLVFNSAFYNTSSNTKMAIAYSLNGFTTPVDSTEITGATGPGGAQTLTASGTFNNSFPLLNQTAANTALYRVALNGPSTANPSGGVTVAAGKTLTVRLYYACGSTGIPRYAFLKNLRVKGDVVAAPLVSNVLKYWPLRANNTDSTQARSTRVVASTPTLKRLYLSNGTTMASIPAYSNAYGQAFGASANGDGTWTAVGGTLNRMYYEQFTLTVAAGSTARVDSLLLNSAFYNTSSNTKMGVVYSLNGFTTPADSTEIVAGTGPNGALAFTASGTLNNSFPLLNKTTANTDLYHLALRKGGIALNGGQTLTVRLYFACGSTGTPRYAFLKNVRFKGAVQAVLAVNAQTLSAEIQLYPNPASTSFQVQLPAQKSVVSAALFNTLGQNVRTQQLGAIVGQPINAAFDVRGLAAGVYTLRLNVDGTPLTRKVVIE
jgi:hypothetical protein